MIVAGTMPHRIERLVILESFGLFTTSPGEVPNGLVKAIGKRPSGRPPKVFNTEEEAAKRRAEKNVVTDRCFTTESAMVRRKRHRAPCGRWMTKDNKWIR